MVKSFRRDDVGVYLKRINFKEMMMSTRGVWGLRKDDVDKVCYNQMDSYPSGLGENVVELIRMADDETLSRMFDEIELVDAGDTPSKEDVERYKSVPGLVNLSVSESRLQDWYCLIYSSHYYPLYFLPDAVFEIEVGFTSKKKCSVGQRYCRHMVDSKEFLLDGLCCEWAYIINVNTKVLEVYRGLCSGEKVVGRYAEDGKEDESSVSLILAIPFDVFRGGKSLSDMMKR